jgi:hypothetical protein
MKERLFPFLIALSALSVSASAAFYSVFGLSKLFAGASYQVMVMAGSLEFAKLVVASLLYQYWGTINKLLRAYLSLAILVLILITSGGIYGFLSGAYQETATQSELLGKGLRVLELKQNRFEERKSDLALEKEQLNKSISDLRISLSNPAQVSWYDKNAGEVITTTSSSTRRALQGELDKTIIDRNTTNIRLEATQDSLLRLDREVLDLEISNEGQSELGPLKYLSEVTGKPMNKVVNWFLLLIIFVFDPLAIAMVIAANFAFSRVKRKNKKPKEGTLVNDKVSDIEEDMYNTMAQHPEEGYHPPRNEEKLSLEELSKIVGKEEINLQPVKPSEEDLKKLENVLGLHKTSTSQPINVGDNKKVLTYRKRLGDDNKK